MKDKHSPPPNNEDEYFADPLYADIPKQCVMFDTDSDRMAWGRIYDGCVVATGPNQMLANLLKRSEIRDNDALGAYIHADGARKITFEGILELVEGPLPENSAGVDLWECLYHFDNIILDAHYTKTPIVRSVRIEYPFNWGPMTNTHEHVLHKDIHIPDCGISIKVIQEAEQDRILDRESIERFLTYRITADAGIDMNDMTKYVWQLNNFLTLFDGSPVYPQRLTMTDTADGKFLYYPRSMFDLKRRIPSTSFARRVEYDEIIHERFECLLRRWFLLYRKVGRPISEYFESVRGNRRHRDGLHRAKFIDHTNTMQRIYRKTDRNTRNLCEPLSDAVNIYQGVYSPDSMLITRMNATRNHYVHGDSEKPRPNAATSDSELSKFSNIAAMLIEGKLMNMIVGDDPDLLHSILEKIHRAYMESIMDVPGFIDSGGPEPGESNPLPIYTLTTDLRSSDPRGGHNSG